MSDYHNARAKGYALVEAFVRAMEAAVPDGLDGYRRAKWLEDAYGAAVAVVNGEHRDAFAATAAEYAKKNAA
jgi:hypothetical protein